MLHSLFRLASESDGSLRLMPTGQRSWRPTVIVPREVCVFESSPTQGVAWHEIGRFARLQADRLAPFVRSGGNAAVRRKSMMFWFWDAAEVDAALVRGGLAADKVRKFAEPLMLPVPHSNGEFRLQCAAGVDVMSLRDGAIVHSEWQHTSAPLSADSMAWTTTPWARDRLGSAVKLEPAGSAVLVATRALSVASWLAIVGSAGYTAYWDGRGRVAADQLASDTQSSTASSQALARVSEYRRLERDDASWVRRYEAAGAGLDAMALLDALVDPVRAQGAVVKEFEVQGSQLRLLLVSAGGSLAVPGLLTALATVPGVKSVQLQQNPDAQQASFLMNIDAFRHTAQSPLVGGTP